ncbi:DUF1269 domain-containing protein [Actinokineospora auranticolor]|uniref:Putative membrane protein n=1 Tax=Actinokineospora auranticolor TaxID=155976 RepID=A0A2S6H1Q4_9PSEU|nr:DUF1269 domain-containing protein [Actinokineospora auranticolor]PPK71361.1 putative membrane protein [Actinokineospora auranticolor]
MSATLTVWKFPTAEGAEQARDTVESLRREGALTLVDAAVVSWPEGESKPRTKQLHGMVGAGALTGTFWGLLFGILFFMPLIGAAIGAASGALGGKFTDIGIDDGFISDVRAKVVPGTSALFLLTEDVVLDRIHDAFPGGRAELVHTNLDDRQEQALRTAFA